jgi:hypothetical protein
MDSLAPARSALAGLRLRQIPFTVSQTAQVVSKKFFACSAWFAVDFGKFRDSWNSSLQIGVHPWLSALILLVADFSQPVHHFAGELFLNGEVSQTRNMPFCPPVLTDAQSVLQ